MNLPRQGLLAGSALADQKQAGIRGCHQPGRVEQAAKGRRIADQPLGLLLAHVPHRTVSSFELWEMTP
jgi:hypothetical protein